MMPMQQVLDSIRERIRQAAAAKQALNLRGGGSKDWYGEAARGEVLELGAYRGIVSYEPTELVVTARCGTPLRELEHALAGQGQMLAFEPPHFGAAATVGGCVAAGLSGPRRAAAGAVRDFVLGTQLVDAQGQVLRFGGQVMKNVAGYDLSRALVGSLGILGAIVEVSFKVLPRPALEQTVRLEQEPAEAIAALNAWAGQPLPISASAWWDGQLWLRLSGSESAVDAARRYLGGEAVDQADALWAAIREHTHPFFDPRPAEGMRLWRLALPSSTPPLNLPGRKLVEWGGAQRWLWSDVSAEALRERVARAGGHASVFRGDKSCGAFHPLAPGVAALHRRLKQALDPAGLFNPGRLIADM
jgi:glycolate oxidase FAD binding subunit